jgi:acyl-CoA synthetase (AMP-forming)/AMP-acid ligase II
LPTPRLRRRRDWRRAGFGRETWVVGARTAISSSSGRLKELIIRSGFNVYPAEVETALNAHPDALPFSISS